MQSNERSSVGAVTTPRLCLLASAAALVATAWLTALVTPGPSAAAPARTHATGPLVSTATTSLGRILVDSNGRTLYLFEKDKSGKSACAGKCSSFWPPLIAAGKPRAGSGAKASLLGTTKRSDGKMQVTYNRHPLYAFVEDTKKGQTRGENIDAYGAEWYAVSSAGTKVEPKPHNNASGNTTTPTASSGSGY